MFVQESIGASSVAGSGVNGGNDATSGSEQCAVECLQNKLLATMRIVCNWDSLGIDKTMLYIVASSCLLAKQAMV